MWQMQAALQTGQQGFTGVASCWCHRQEMGLVGHDQPLILEQHFCGKRDGLFVFWCAVIPNPLTGGRWRFGRKRLTVRREHESIRQAFSPCFPVNTGKLRGQMIKQQEVTASRGQVQHTRRDAIQRRWTRMLPWRVPHVFGGLTLGHAPKSARTCARSCGVSMPRPGSCCVMCTAIG